MQESTRCGLTGLGPRFGAEGWDVSMQESIRCGTIGLDCRLHTGKCGMSVCRIGMGSSSVQEHDNHRKGATHISLACPML